MTLQITPGMQGGTTSIVHRDGEAIIEHRGVERFQPAKQQSGIEGILGTGRQLTGAMVSGISDVIDSTLFTVNGVQMCAKSAANIGLLVCDAPNCYRLPVAGEAAVEDEAAPAEEPFTDHLPKPVLEALTELDANLGSPKATDSAVAGSIAHLANGNLEGAVKDFTNRTGLDPETARGYVEGVLADTRASVIARLADFGVRNGEECLQHLDATMSPSAKASIALELFAGSNTAFKRVANNWLRHMENSVMQAQWKK